MRIDLAKIIAKTKSLSTKIVCSWGEFINFLSTELLRIKEEGDIQVNPPEVVIPDGITSTTPISQSEMTQFVTNTLNTWLYSINGEPSEGIDIGKILFPKVYDYSTESYLSTRVTPLSEIPSIYTSSYNNLMCNFFNTNEYGINPDNNVVGVELASPNYVYPAAGFDGIAPLPFSFPFAFNQDSGQLHVRFLDELIDENNSNIRSIYRYHTFGDYEVSMQYGVKIVGKDNEIGCAFNFTPQDNNYIGKSKLVIEWQVDNLAAIPLLQLSRNEPWYSSSDIQPLIKFVLTYPRYNGINYIPYSPK